MDQQMKDILRNTSHMLRVDLCPENLCNIL